METLKLNEPGGEMGAHATQTEAIQTQKKNGKIEKKKRLWFELVDNNHLIESKKADWKSCEVKISERE